MLYDVFDFIEVGSWQTACLEPASAEGSMVPYCTVAS